MSSISVFYISFFGIYFLKFSCSLKVGNLDMMIVLFTYHVFMILSLSSSWLYKHTHPFLIIVSLIECDAEDSKCFDVNFGSLLIG